MNWMNKYECGERQVAIWVEEAVDEIKFC